MSLWLASPYFPFIYLNTVPFLLSHLLILSTAFIVEDSAVSEDKGVQCLPLVLVIIAAS